MEHLSFSNTFEALRRQLNINANPMTMPDFNFSDSDICCDLGNDPEPKFLDEYTEEDFHKILKENGFIEDLKNLGYSKTILRMECKDKFVHRLSLLDRSLMTSADQPITEKNFLMDMFMRKKELVTYQLKAYQDLKYRANHMTNNEAEIIDTLPDVPEKRKFKPDYLKNEKERKKERNAKLRNLSDFNKIENNNILADNLNEANTLTQNINKENAESKISTPSSTVNNTSSTGYNFSMYSLGRTFALNRNPSSSHGSTVDIDVIEVSSASSYSEDEEVGKNTKKSDKKIIPSNADYEEDADDENEDSKSISTLSSLNDEIKHNNNELNKELLKTNVLGDTVNNQKLPLDPNMKLSKQDQNKNGTKNNDDKKNINRIRSRELFKFTREDNKSKHSSYDFSTFINNLTFGNSKRNNSQPPMTAYSVINSIFSFLNNSIKEEKPIAPVLETPKSPPIPESSQESAPENFNDNINDSDKDNNNNKNNINDNNNSIEKINNNGTKQKLIEDVREQKETTKVIEMKSQGKNNENPIIIAPTPVHVISNEIKKINETSESIPIIKINDNDDENTIRNDIETATISTVTTNNTVVAATEEKKQENAEDNLRTNARMDMSLQPTSPEEVRKKKLTPLIVSKKGAMLLIKFMEKNINVVPEMKITEIEWVCMQNPRGTFTTKRPQCPGQRFPGLKMGRKISNLMISLAKLRGRDGLCDTPEHFHNAAIYSQKGYMFINPAFHGYFVSLLFDLNKDMREHGLAAVSWAFKLGHVINRKTKKPEFWHPEEQIYPTSDRLHKYFISDQYLALVEHYRKVHLNRVYIDWNEAKECLAYSIKIKQIEHIVFSDHENDDNDDKEDKQKNENQKNENKEEIKNDDNNKMIIDQINSASNNVEDKKEENKEIINESII